MNCFLIRRLVGWLTRGIALAFAVVLVAPAFTGCGGRYGVETQKSSDGTTTYTLANNEIAVEGGTKYYGGMDERNRLIEKQCFLDFRAREKPGAARAYELVLIYNGVAELNIKPGRSLQLTVDLNKTVLSSGGEVRKGKDPSGRFFTESLDYPVERELLLRMAEATTIRVDVTGQDGELAGSFDNTNFANLRSFVSQCVQ